MPGRLCWDVISGSDGLGERVRALAVKELGNGDLNVPLRSLEERDGLGVILGCDSSVLVEGSLLLC